MYNHKHNLSTECCQKVSCCFSTNYPSIYSERMRLGFFLRTQAIQFHCYFLIKRRFIVSTSCGTSKTILTGIVCRTQCFVSLAFSYNPALITVTGIIHSHCLIGFEWLTVRTDWSDARHFAQAWTFEPDATTLTCIIKRLRELKRKQANASWSSVSIIAVFSALFQSY